MLTHILIGVEDSPESRDAIALGAALAATAACDVTLVHCVGPPVAQVLQAQAERCGAEMIVIGSASRAASGHCAIGSIGRRLLANDSVDLAIARRGLSERDLRVSRVAVGYDGAHESESALRLADSLACAAGADLVIETIYEMPLPAIVGRDRARQRELEQLRTVQRRGALDVARRAVARTSPRSRLNVCAGDPGLALRRASAGVDLMIIGSRRWGAAARFELGGAGDALTEDCGCSLIIAQRRSAQRDSAQRESAQRDSAPRQGSAHLAGVGPRPPVHSFGV